MAIPDNFELDLPEDATPKQRVARMRELGGFCGLFRQSSGEDLEIAREKALRAEQAAFLAKLPNIRT